MIYVIAFSLIAIILGKTAFLYLCETNTGKEKNISGGTVQYISQCLFEIAENKQIIIYDMAEGAIVCHSSSWIPQVNQKPPCEEGLCMGRQSIRQKQEQHSQLKLKSILGSQLTQEHSGISCAFKAHILIMAFERIRTRRVGRCFTALRKCVCGSDEVMAAGLQGESCKKISTCNQDRKMAVDGVQLNISGSKLAPASSELPQFGFLQLLNLKSSHKFLSRQTFEYKIKVSSLEKRVAGLQSELAEAQRRQEREMVKKRETLASLAEELGEKNEVIEELKGIVKGLRIKLNMKNNASGPVLEEDSDSLRKSLLHIEGVNDRLNFDLARVKQTEKGLLQQVRTLSADNERLKVEIGRLREQGFEAASIREQADLGRKECAIWERRLRAREDRLSVMEKRVNELARSRGGQSSRCIAYCTEKRFESVPALETTTTQREIDLSTKIEAIFQFFFHIDDQAYGLHSPELFDSEQREFLHSQKMKISNIFESGSKSQCITPIKSKKLQEQSIMVNDFACSILDLIERQSQKPSTAHLQESAVKRYETEVGRLREQIGELKDKQLFVRSVLLSFIKSLQLRSIKKQSENILELLYDFYEYSEEERGSLFQSKARKIFGFI